MCIVLCRDDVGNHYWRRSGDWTPGKAKVLGVIPNAALPHEEVMTYSSLVELMQALNLTEGDIEK